ncbi:lytic transglycosylase domain-containing protein [Rhodotorula paludigena]|uniref:lytic transglycosylase domain-containing protein n=1 Tax=Rhodotorula paludigena TaxID=86838 RepID=UPI00316D21E4
MHFATLLTVAASASTLAAARLDRRHGGSHSHREAARSVLSKRTPTPEPFRLFAAPEGSAPAPSFDDLDGVVALRKRDSGDLNEVIARIGDVVNEVAVAYKLALPTTDDATAQPVADLSQAAASAHQKAAEEAAAEKQRQEQAAAAKAAKEAKQKKLAAQKQAAEEAAAAQAAAEKKAKGEAAAKKKAAAIAARKKAEAEAKAAAEAAAAKAAAEQKAQEEAAAKAAAEKKAQEEAAARAQAKAEAEAKAQAEAQAKAQAKAQAEAEAAAAKKAAQEKAAADKAAAEKAAAEKAAAEKAAAKKAAAEAKKEADTNSNTKLAVFNPGKTKSLIGFSADNCGPSGADDSQPNGALSWLNCGIDKSKPSSGWTPPAGVTLDRITTVSLEHALATNHVWDPCKSLVHVFEKVGADTGLPAILLASFALQESTCNPNTMGGGGEVGLMQITPDKCGGRSAAACRDPEFNVRTAAEYFKRELDNQGGAFLRALGAYNGWQPGMSYQSATAAKSSGCCTCQNNLDYLFQMTNGWLVGKTGYELKSYNNLAVCD